MAKHENLTKGDIMTQKKPKEKKPEIDLNFMQSSFHGNFITMGKTKVYNLELTSPKMHDIINHILNGADWGADHLIIHQNEPEGKNGLWVKALKTVVVNLGEIWQDCEDQIAEEDTYDSVRLNVHHNFLDALMHELWHAAKASANDPKYNKLTDKKKDEMANDLAIESIEKMAVNYDVEPGPMSNEPFFGTRYMRLFVEKIKDSKETWAVRQNEMHDEKHVYVNENSGQYVASYREYLKGSSDIRDNDDKWDATTPKPLDKFKYLPVEKTTISVSKELKDAFNELTKTETPAPEVNVAPTMESYPDVDNVDDHSYMFYDDRDCKDIYEEMLYGGNQLDQTFNNPQTSQQTVHSLPPVTPPVAQQTKCACGADVMAGAKFCPFCGAQLASAAQMTQQPVIQQPMAQQPVVQGQVTQQPVVQYAQQGMAPMPTAGARGYTETLRANLPQTGLSDAEVTNMAYTLWHRIDRFIFERCGWRMPLSQAVINDVNDDKSGFNSNIKYTVLDGVDVSDIPNIEKLIVAQRTLEQISNKNKKLPLVGGKLRGFITKDGLPMFSVYMNYNGTELKRNVVPQNPWKIKGNDYTSPAKLAQQGHQILWVLDGDDRKSGFNAKAKYVNGQPEAV